MSLLSRAKPLAGHLVDLFRMAAMRFDNPHSYTKFRILDAVRRRTGARVFVESGTYRGITARRCAGVFDHVYTIELSETLASEATEALADLRNVEVLQGDGVEVLGRLFGSGRVDGAVVFLDGHYSGGPTAQGTTPEPALEELAVLGRFKDHIQGIVIDDFRAFGTEPGFPTKGALLAAAEAHFGAEFRILAQLDQVILERDARPRRA